MNQKTFDVAIVGSGPSGVHAAYPLVKAGLRVILIDGGIETENKDALRQTAGLLKIKSNIEIIQSLAKGGLSQVWPGICDFFTNQELKQAGLPPNQIQNEYKEIKKLINLNLNPKLDVYGKSILNSCKDVYQLALAYPYRTSNVVNDFKKYKNFTYSSKQVVYILKEKRGYVELQSLSFDKLTTYYTFAHFVILTAGSINTTRILLRSFDLFNYKTPFLTKNFFAFICFNPKVLFKRRGSNFNYGQVAISNENYFIQFYKCNPASFYKALPYIPMPKKISLLLLQIFIPYLIIADIRFPTFEGKNRFLKLKPFNKEDVLEISFHQTKNELQKQSRQIKKIKNQLLSLGVLPLKMIKGDVTSHYAGGVPIRNKQTKLSVDSDGKLHQGKRIYIADASTWRALSAKPPTLTIMANASRIGKNVLERFKRNDK